ncbi:MAG: (2Fe-2S)-binding protein [Oligoflexia bacterium]|nr:(2Fe-2S)-binding protein [Oligoflexia bacterium]
MYVCICHQVTEDQVREAVSSSKSTSDTLKKLGVGGSCGICLIDAVKKLEEEIVSHKNSSLTSLKDRQKS